MQMSVKRAMQSAERRAGRLWGALVSALRPKAKAENPEDRLAQIQESVRTLRSEISGQLSFQNFDLVNELRAELERIAEGDSQRHARVNERLDELERRQSLDGERLQRELLERMETRFAELRDGLSAAVADASEATRAVQALRSEMAGQISFLEHDLTAHADARAEAALQQVSALTNALAGQGARTEELAEDVSKLRGEFALGLRGLETALAQTAADLSGTSLTAISQLRAEITALTDRLQALEDDAAARGAIGENSVRELAASLAQYVSDLNGRLGALELANETSARGSEAALARVEANLLRRLGGLELDGETYARNVAGDVAALRSELLGRLNALEADFGVKTAQSVEASSRELFARLSELQANIAARLDALEAEIAARAAATAGVEVSLRQMSDGLAELRSELTGQVQRLEQDIVARVREGAEVTAHQLTTLSGALQSRNGDAATRGDGAARIAAAIESRMAELGASAFELRNRLIGLDTAVSSRMNQAETTLVELANKVAHVETAVLSRLNEIETASFEAANALLEKDNSAQFKLDAAHAALTEVADRVRGVSGDLQTLVALSTTSGNRLVEAETRLLSRLNELENANFEAANRLLSLQGTVESRVAELNNHAFELKNGVATLDGALNSRINDMVFVQLPGLLSQVHEVCALQLEAIGAGRASAVNGHAYVRPKLRQVPSFEAVLRRAERDFPAVYGAWRERLDEMAAAFAETKEGNAAHAADPYSRLFRMFVQRYARGAVLDIGCGPFGRPYYLNSYPAELIAGIEPLAFPAPSEDIQLVRGISEYLPWPDRAFQTVISATSLDHCLSLERSLAEMLRVLAPDGVALLWLGSNPGAPPFRPDDPDFEPADRFHLFHFDIEWFEPMLQRQFEVVDRVKLDRAGYSHVFYALRPVGAEAAASPTAVTGSRAPRSGRTGRSQGAPQGGG